MKAKVRLSYGNMHASVVVPCEPDDSDDEIIARAWASLRRRELLTLSMVALGGVVESREL